MRLLFVLKKNANYEGLLGYVQWPRPWKADYASDPTSVGATRPSGLGHTPSLAPPLEYSNLS